MVISGKPLNADVYSAAPKGASNTEGGGLANNTWSAQSLVNILGNNITSFEPPDTGAFHHFGYHPA